MGFSVSGAAAIIFASLFIAFGMWFTAASNGFDAVTEAQDHQTESTLETANTDFEIVTAEYDNPTLTVEANNTGATVVSLDETDLLVDGEFVDGWESDATVGPQNDAGTDLWQAGEQLTITVDLAATPSRVKLVTPSGVSTTSTVTEVTP